MMRARNDQGFTLIEVLISMFVFSIIAVGTMSALNSTLRGKAQIDDRLSYVAEIDLARAIMKSDIDNIRLRPSRDMLGSKELYVMSGGVDALVSFTRGGRPNPGGLERRSDIERIRYVFEDGAIIREALSHENPAADTKTIRRTLLEDVVRANMTFESANSVQSQLFIAPGNPQGVPEVIRLEIEFEDGGRLTQYFEVRA